MHVSIKLSTTEEKIIKKRLVQSLHTARIHVCDDVLERKDAQKIGLTRTKAWWQRKTSIPTSFEMDYISTLTAAASDQIKA